VRLDSGEGSPCPAAAGRVQDDEADRHTDRLLMTLLPFIGYAATGGRFSTLQ